MQLESLAAFSPLFPSTRKNNYALSVAIFLESVSRHLQQRELFKYIASVNLTRKNHYLAFDEALENHGVKLVKQNLASNLSDPMLLKQQITAIQDENERILKLYAELVGDNTISTKDRAVKQCIEVLWQLIDELTHAFDLSDSTQHHLFRHASEMTPEGYTKMFMFYEIRLKRLNKLLDEEVYKSKKKVTTGRRAKNLGTVSVKQYQSFVKENK